MWAFLCASLLLAWIVWYLQYHWTRRHLYRLSRNVPGPRGWPILGNILDFAGGPDAIHENVMKQFDSFPGICKVWHGPRLVYAVSKPEYLEAILTSPTAHSKHEMLKYVRPIFGLGLFTAPVPTWKHHRRAILPGFNLRILNGYVGTFAKHSTIMSRRLEEYTTRGEFDIFDVVSRCTLDTICETIMGISVDAQTTDSPVGQWVDRLLEIAFLRMFVLWYHFDAVFKWTRLRKDHERLLGLFDGFTEKVIKEKRAAFERGNGGDGEVERKSFLDHLIALSGEHKLTEDEIRDEVKTFLVAGTDTSSSTESFIFVTLALHPRIQDRIYDEVMEILGPSRAMAASDLPRFNYTERVIKETMRVFPVGAYIARQIDDDLVLEDDLILPKGSSAFLGIMSVHRNAELWPEPMKFEPDRFLSEEVAKRHPFSYLPFSRGPRNCVGPTFAMMAMKTMVATVVRKFRFSTSYKSLEDVKLTSNFILKPLEGYRVSVELRK